METTKIKATNTTLTPAITSYVESKLSKDILSKFSGSNKILDVNVDIGKTTGHHTHGEIFRAEINVSIKGKVLRAVSDKEDLYSAIDDVHDEIIEVLKDRKEKKEALWRRGARKVKNILRWGKTTDNT
jgi:ribosomal subunit interface protein